MESGNQDIEIYEAPKSHALVQQYDVLKGIDAIVNPCDFLDWRFGAPCGLYPNSWNFVQLQNTHPTRRIRLWLNVEWVYENVNYSRSVVYDFNPGETLDIGCPQPGPTSQMFWHRKIAAQFI